MVIHSSLVLVASINFNSVFNLQGNLKDIISDCKATRLLGSQRKQRSRVKGYLLKKNPTGQSGSRLGEMSQGTSPTWGVKHRERLKRREDPWLM